MKNNTFDKVSPYDNTLISIGAIFEEFFFELDHFFGLHLTAEGKNVMTNARFVLFTSSRVGLKKVPWKNIV